MQASPMRKSKPSKGSSGPVLRRIILVHDDSFRIASPRHPGERVSPIRHLAPAEVPNADYPLYLTTGRVLAQYQSGTQTRRVGRLQEMMPAPLVEIHPTTARSYGLAPGDTAKLTTPRGSALFTVKVTASIRQDTVFVPFHWSGQQSVNRLTNPALDPTSRMPEFKVCAVRIERAEQAAEV